MTIIGPGDGGDSSAVTDAIGSTGGYDNESHGWQSAIDSVMDGDD